MWVGWHEEGRLFSLNHLAVAVLEIFRSEALVADVVVDRAAAAFGER
jgi:hypothetical protein